MKANKDGRRRFLTASASVACLCLALSGCDQQAAPNSNQPAARTPNTSAEAAPGTGATADSSIQRPPERLAQRSGVPTAAAPSAPVEMAQPRVTPTEQGDDATVANFAGLSAPKPAAWQFRQPQGSSGMRVAEYSVPGAEGGDQADIIVYQFPGGGTLEANVDRWKGQFKHEDGSAVDAKVTELETDGLKVAIAELSGDYRGMGKSEYASDQILIAGMIETDGSPVFVQLVGPRKTVEASREAFMTMLRGVKKIEPMK